MNHGAQTSNGFRRIWVAALVLCACSDGPRDTGLLAERSPVAVTEVRRAQRLSDGVIATEGDPWDSDLSAVLGAAASVSWDLGEPRTIRSAFLQGDGNDAYVLSVSSDGNEWTTFWTAAAERPRAGLVSHIGSGFEAHGRFIRLSAARGDGRYAVSEVATFESSNAASAAAKAFSIARGTPPAEVQRSAIVIFGLALVGFVVIARRGSPWLSAAALLLPLWAGIRVYEAFALSWPVGPRELSALRATAAVAALAAIAREVFAPRSYPANRLAVFGTLGVSAVLAMAAFFNLGHPQFTDAKHAQPSAVHGHDMRVYYPAAKYFSELRFDGVYLASTAAYLEDAPNATPEALATLPIRDLKTHESRRIADVLDEVRTIKQRFSPERWRSFVEDMRYFRETMGDQAYLGSMTDHGANATPVWLAIANLIFANTTASTKTLLATALLDPLLLLVTFIAIGRTFGPRTALVSIVVFGANDFYMFGSNWVGATLRHDWIAYLALGACALKQERWRLGGALLAASAMIRAFPALALAGACIPAVWWFVEHIYRHRALPSLQQLRDAQTPTLRIAFGAAACVATLFIFSGVVVGFDAWGDWFHKVGLLDRDPHVNHISLRGLVAGQDALHSTTLSARMPLFVALVLMAIGLVAAAARKLHPSRAAMLGTILIPIAFNPANYYLHAIFVWPLLAAEQRATAPTRRDFAIWAIVLSVCALGYWTVLAPGWELHFQLATLIFFAAVAALLVTIIRYDWRRARSPSQDVIP